MNGWVKRDGKFLWSDEKWKEYCDTQVKKLKEETGCQANTRIVTRFVLDKVIIPNKIEMTDLIKPHIKINKKLWKKRLI